MSSEERIPLHSGENSSQKKEFSLSRQSIIVIAVLVVVLAAAVTIVLVLVVRETLVPEPLIVSNAAVAADHPTCSKVGVDVMREGGNAIDAAIATGLCLGVVNPQSSGIGGGSVILIHLANGEKHFYDSREIAPGAAHPDMYNHDRSASAFGGLAVAVPGEIKGYEHIFKLHGSGNVTWQRLFEPAIQLAGNGFPVGPALANTLRDYENLILANPSVKAIFAPQGRVLQAGELCQNTELARTLTTISELGAAGFYNGSLTANMVQEINEAGGNITLQDFLNYEVLERDPVSWFYQGLQIVGGYPPFYGASAHALSLNILEYYQLSTRKYDAESIHLIIESWKFAFADRMSLGDPAYINVTNDVRQMLDKNHAAKLRLKITPKLTHAPTYYRDLDLVDPVTDHGTSHFSVVDSHRNIVALTTTINTPLGSLVLGNRTGILFNNEMDDFSSNGTNTWGLAPALANWIYPGKRPLSSMSPTIVYKNTKPWLAIGASGGPRIVTSTHQVLLNLINFGEGNLKEAIDQSRFHCQLIPPIVNVEKDFSKSFTNDLKGMGHNISISNSGLAVVQAIIIQDDKLIAASDKRKFGAPDGY